MIRTQGHGNGRTGPTSCLSCGSRGRVEITTLASCPSTTVAGEGLILPFTGSGTQESEPSTSSGLHSRADPVEMGAGELALRASELAKSPIIWHVVVWVRERCPLPSPLATCNK